MKQTETTAVQTAVRAGAIEAADIIRFNNPSFDKAALAQLIETKVMAALAVKDNPGEVNQK